jgi:hypothetical protein
LAAGLLFILSSSDGPKPAEIPSPQVASSSLESGAGEAFACQFQVKA